MVTTENEKQKAFGIHSYFGGMVGEEAISVKLCFETIEATSYLLEAHDVKQVEMSN